MTSPTTPPQPPSIAARQRAGVDRRDEVSVIHRDTRVPELFEPQGETCMRAAPAADGWFSGRATGLQMHPGRPGKLLVRLGDSPASGRELPES